MNRAVLYLKAKEAISAQPRKLVQAEDIMAVCLQESSGVPTFRLNEPLYKMNMTAAMRKSGLSERTIMNLMTITEGPFKGYISKFRYEPAYYSWSTRFPEFNAGEKLILACSFGIGQKMARWLVNKLDKDSWLPYIRKFMGDIELQLLYVAGDLEHLLIMSNGDLFKAYKGYNSGNIHSIHPSVIERAKGVVKIRDDLKRNSTIATDPQ